MNPTMAQLRVGAPGKLLVSLKLDGGGVKTFGLGGKTPWDELGCMALTSSGRSSPAVKRCISAPPVRLAAGFNRFEIPEGGATGDAKYY